MLAACASLPAWRPGLGHLWLFEPCCTEGSWPRDARLGDVSYGHLMLWRSGHVLGPIASLGFGPGSYGHNDRAVRWSAG